MWNIYPQKCSSWLYSGLCELLRPKYDFRNVITLPFSKTSISNCSFMSLTGRSSRGGHWISAETCFSEEQRKVHKLRVWSWEKLSKIHYTTFSHASVSYYGTLCGKEDFVAVSICVRLWKTLFLFRCHMLTVLERRQWWACMFAVKCMASLASYTHFIRWFDSRIQVQ